VLKKRSHAISYTAKVIGSVEPKNIQPGMQAYLLYVSATCPIQRPGLMQSKFRANRIKTYVRIFAA
jgi:hypothetical protein